MNEENDRNTQRQQTEEITGREEVGEGAIKKVRTQGESVLKSKRAKKIAQYYTRYMIF